MKTTTSFDKHIEDDNTEVLADTKQRSNSSARLTTPTRSAAPSENGDISDSVEKRKTISNGEVPSFMKPTKNFEIRDKHNEEAVARHDEKEEPERRVSATRKLRLSLVEGELPSYMKTTKSHEIREHATATGAVETTSLERALQGPMIDDFPEPKATAPTKSRKSSVGGFLRKKFGLGKGRSV